MKKIYVLILHLLVFLSCKKETPQPPDTTPAVPAEVDVYVSGYVSDYGDTYYDVGYPTYWKNGSPVKIGRDFSPDYGYSGGSALSIAVSGNNLYAAGIGLFVGPYRIGTGVMFWKNGNDVDVWGNSLTGEIYQLSSLAVSNYDVYMLGLGTADNATYFKNGSPIVLSNGAEGTMATSIAVSGNDVYVAGISFNRNYYYGGYNRMARYWKNGNPVKLTDGTKDAYTTSIAVSGNDVYVSGSEDSIAKYWKNGKPVNLTEGLTYADANSIAASGTNVYVAGTQWDGNIITNANGITYRNPIAKYWKNGKPVNLTDGSKWAVANSIAVSGNDVYVAGFEEDVASSGNYVAKYWKNGSPVILGDVSKNSKAYSIFLAPK